MEPTVAWFVEIVLEKNDVIIFLEIVEVDVIEGFRGRSAIQVYKRAFKIILIKVAEKKPRVHLLQFVGTLKMLSLIYAVLPKVKNRHCDYYMLDYT